MKAVPRPQTFLFLQGPPGPLFRRLGAAMAERGIAVQRINICGGDEHDWPDGAVPFRGHLAEWAAFFERFVREHGTTDLMLFGDCRPYHVTALGIAQQRGIRTHVLEEGYIRPHWMTLEPDGVNARSKLSRDKTWFVREANRLPPEPELPPVTASFRRRARDSFWHFGSVFFGRLRYPHYRSHRPTPIVVEGVSWLWKLLWQKQRAARARAVLDGLAGKPNFVFPLQLSSDYQIRSHSHFADMQSAATYVIESFAANAPKDVHLILKAHPLDPSFFNWSSFIRAMERRLGLRGRLHFVDGGQLETMLEHSRGLVCVNSTSATLALARNLPVCAIGQAIYDMPGLTHQGQLHRFWQAPTPPEPGVYAAFRRVLVDRCLVRGGLASKSATDLLIRSVLDRLGIAQRGMAQHLSHAKSA
jgi:capsular polysaccharide export protein